MQPQQSKWQRIESPVLPTPRFGSSVLLDPKNKTVLLFGGVNSSLGYLDDVWSSDGLHWERRPFAIMPTGRYGLNLAWDEKRRVAVLFGGMRDGELLGDTWQFNGVQWIRRSPGVSPSPRMNACMAHDIARGQTILFGGKANTGKRYLENLNETWVWDGEIWQQIYSANTPVARSGANLIYDRARETLILFGGQSEGRLLSDTWLWDGKAWTEQQAVNHPMARDEFGMTYHEGKQQIILFGGQSFKGLATDTWIWNGHDWSLLRTTQSPPNQIAYGVRLVYSPTLDSVVLYNAFREKLIVSDESFTITERSEVWQLEY